jgi:GNAT superfamily N-acetyltransferase
MEIGFEKEMPNELLEFKVEHYKEIFQDQWEKVFAASSSEKQVVVLRDLDKIVGGCAIELTPYNLRFEDFAILPEARGKGYAKILMDSLEGMAKGYHIRKTCSGEKPTDIKLMYLKSLVYLDFDIPDIPAFQFAPFLKRFGFKPYVYNRLELSDAELVALEVYQQLYPDFADSLRVFKKLVVNEGVELNQEAQQELLSLNKKQWNIVVGGLNWKLGNYGKTGRVSYRYDLCSICADMESSEQNSENCRRCYIYKTCMEPFRERGRFKEDFEVSNAYFSAMRDFMLGHEPKQC